MAAAPKVVPTNELADTQGRVRRMILERLHVEVPANDTDLFSTGIIDSLGLVELLLGLKEEFGVDVDVGTVDLDVLSSIERVALIVDQATREQEQGQGALATDSSSGGVSSRT